MTCSTGRYVLVFNGEIYNHQELRRELDGNGTARPATREGAERPAMVAVETPLVMAEGALPAVASTNDTTGVWIEEKSLGRIKPGVAWRGHSDTETLLAGFLAWGVRPTIERCIGMFAFALWDRKERILTLARDRIGEKPIYYGWQGQGESACFLFGSELKALTAHPSFRAPINRDALCLLMRYNYINAPHTIYEGIHKLPPGHLLTVALRRREPAIEQYWSLIDAAEAGVAKPITSRIEEATDELEALLASVVRQQMVADVPLGAFLSGGIDSSSIVALMQAQSSRRVKTFTIGFHEEGHNEARHAKAVARHLGTEHTELYVTPERALSVIPKLPELYCEPFADSSQIPTFLVSQLARQHVTVALSGDAGDELFAGYSRYIIARNLWRKLAWAPATARGQMAAGIKAVPPAAWDLLFSPLQRFIPRSRRHAELGDKLHKGAGVLAMRDLRALYQGLVSLWEPYSVVVGATERPTPRWDGDRWPNGLDDIEHMMALDATTYLPGDILVKVDRAAMGVSLETRAPFLDHRVIELAWRIPQSMKLRDGVGKWILRKLLYRHVPKELFERPKMGFGVPIGEWLRGPLRDWAESLLDESRLRQEGYLNSGPIRQKWREHLSGRRNWQYHLWTVLMFEAWLGWRRLDRASDC
jgi:asparagine synthase (glutamine-hydrolysing)